jgi:hypothetical protein
MSDSEIKVLVCMIGVLAFTFLLFLESKWHSEEHAHRFWHGDDE